MSDVVTGDLSARKGDAPVVMFINVEVDERIATDPEAVEKLVEACPVDIYGQGADGGLDIVEQNLDECVLCYLCVDAAPKDTVRVIKLYE